MSRSEKNKAGGKPIKLPPSIFSDWKTIINNYTESNPKVELTPVTKEIARLTDYVNDSWEQQAACLKKATQALHDKKNVNKDQIIQVVEPIVSSGYFTATENLSRRHFIPLVEATSKEINSDNTSFARLYKDYISLDTIQQEQQDMTIAQRALTISATLEFGYGKRVVLDAFHDTLVYIIAALDYSVQQVENYNIDNKTSLSLVDRMNDILYLIKTLHALLSRHMTHAQPIFAKIQNAQENDPDAQLVAKLLGVLFIICTDTDVYARDCSLVAGMTIATIINMAPDVVFARDLILEWFFITTTKEKKSILGVAPTSVLTGESGWSERDVPMLSIVKGLVSSIRSDVLLSKFPNDLEFIPTLKEFQPLENLHEILFFSNNYFCSKADLQSPSKVAAFESMATWLTECKSIIQSCMKDNNKEIMKAASAVFQPKTVDKLVHYVWNHWDDPVDVIQNKVKSIFEVTLDVVEMKATYFKENEAYNNFLQRLLMNLIEMDWHRKVKYALLNILVPKLGTDVFLKAEPNLIWKCLRAMDSLILSPQITAMLMAFLQQRIIETIPGLKPIKNQSLKLNENAETKVPIQHWVHLWAEPVIRALTSSSELLRKNISNFILPSLFKTCPSSFWTLMENLQLEDNDSGFDKDLRLHAFITVLKVGRSLDIVGADAYTLEKSSTDARKIPVDTLRIAIYHHDPQVRLDVLGLMCESRKAITPISKMEMDILREFIPLNMNCTSPEFRQTFCTHISRLLFRLRGILYAKYRSYKSCIAYLDKFTSTEDNKKYTAMRTEAEESLDSIEHGKQFLYWLIKHIETSLYPGASYQRVATSLRLLSTLIKIFGVTELPVPAGFGDQPVDFPFRVPVGTPQLTKVLIDTLMNPFDFNRVQAFEILSQFPNPLPDIESRQDAQHLLWWGLDNVVSTRAGESDSGAMVFRLIFTKYVKELGYDLYPERDSKQKASPAVEMAPVVFTDRLLDLLDKQVEAAKSNLLLAAQQHPMHGTLLALQYIFRELDYQNPSVRAKMTEWKKIHNRALTLVHSVCATVMDVLSNPSPEGNVPSSFREMEEAIDDLIDECGDEGEDNSSGPKHQVILSCCWRAVKEASALLEVIISRAPVTREKSGLISTTDLKESGVLLRTLLTTVRHRGAFSAVYPAYVSLNTRLLDSVDSTTAEVPAQWLEDNLASITSNNISITRRSAGLPLCILAIVSSERSSKKKMLDKTMKTLLELANQEPPPDADQRIDMPQVHAYNIMRTIFMDAKLATAVLGYASDGFSLAISGFSSSSWAIRNCAVMLFSTLLQRTFGTKKTKDEHSAVNKLTGREFFTRYPQLHPYLLEQLKIAVDQLLAKSTATSTVHPGLYPILTLLSRLHPSVMDDADQVAAMAPFVPLVTSCAVSAIFKTREMAARALVPLIPSSELVQTTLMLLDVPSKSTQNEIHGRLLQVQFLLRGHLYHTSLRDHLFDFIKRVPAAIQATVACADLLSRITYALLLDIISEFFFDCAWIFIDRDQGVVEELKELVNENFEPLRKYVLDQCREGLAVPVDPQQVVIGGFLARRSMAQILVQYALQKKDVSDVVHLLDDVDYEVRLISMTLLEKHSNYDMKGMDALQQQLLIKTFKGESNPNCFVLAAKFLLVLKLDFTHVTFTRVEYWNQLVDQFVSSRSQAVTESVLPLLGSLLSQIIEEGTYADDKEWLNQCISLWSKYVVANSRKEITLPLREAAVESIRFMAMHIFENEETTQVQLTITQLLQDDDIDIRNAIAEITSKALVLEAPVHPERATELVYSNLSKSQQHLKELSSSLWSVLLGEEKLRKK
ncbi:putative death-receptor fusion protein-domain-containing protein [Circinella umbellata]|nr:putative death-receptor fusion protein-domain-containing protein [Circinella umbellata]